jgi:site-specific DNA-cytosine methylase
VPGDDGEVNERTHIDLFSGLGGFALAARANGVRTIAFCEIDPRCQAFLAKAWPGVPVWPDIRSLSVGQPIQTGRSAWGQRTEAARYGGAVESNAGSGMAFPKRPERWQETKGRNEHDRTDTGREEASSGPSQCFGDVWLITGGVPCQPASRAGKQRGKEDDRWLWPDAIRVIAAVQPTWALLENPPGIGDVGLHGILSALEAQGYEVRVLSIPACAVNAPHRRERFWIVCRKLADSGSERHQRPDTEPGTDGLCAEYPQSELGNAEAVTGIGRAGPIHQRQAKERRGGDPYTTGLWNSCVWLPCADGKVRRAPDDSISLVDGLHRSLLGALGNSIVWPVAAEIIKAMILSENENMQIQKPHA